jgi:pyruvate,water dikinase
MRPELAPPAEAAALLDRLHELVREQWTIHFLVVIPAQIAAEILNERWVELHGDADPLAAYRLLEGVENAADAAVRRLAARAAELGVDDLVRDLAPEYALARLRSSAPGRRWLHELDGYLLDFGGRSRWHELSLAREAEQPAMTLEAVRLLLERGSVAASPPPAERPPVPAELAELYDRVRAAYALKELHTYDIDYPGLLATREALLGFGRRLVAEGLLEATDDVWMLSADELRDAVVHGRLELRPLVARRRGELAEGLSRGPMPYLGEPPAAVERHHALEKFYGSGGAALAGAGASPGVAEGTARVVAGVEDFARVRAGDVLVTTTTTPAWTPLFASLAALVTETGGILSHAAVVAREYRIPAVVGAAGATTAIPDGARLRVDGTTGRVAILDG